MSRKYKKSRKCSICFQHGLKTKNADIYIHLYTLARQSYAFKDRGIGRMEFVCIQHFNEKMQELCKFYINESKMGTILPT